MKPGWSFKVYVVQLLQLTPSMGDLFAAILLNLALIP